MSTRHAVHGDEGERHDSNRMTPAVEPSSGAVPATGSAAGGLSAFERRIVDELGRAPRGLHARVLALRLYAADPTGRSKVVHVACALRRLRARGIVRPTCKARGTTRTRWVLP